MKIPFIPRFYRGTLTTTVILSLIGVLLPATAFAATPQSCESIAKLRLPNTAMTSAAVVPAGAFIAPNGLGLGPAGPITEDQLVRFGAITVGSKTPAKLPSFCRVQLTFSPETKIEIWLPISGWNGKFQGVGNGGLAGVISYTALANGVMLGYAVASTDTGHDAADETWALGHPERVAQYGYLAIHQMTETAKKIVDAFYGAKPKYSYFSGCSTGGRQALMEAQRYPEDYDGILAGGPANYLTHLLGGYAFWTMIETTKDPERYVPPSKLGLLNDASVAACDALDGVKDGIINDPRMCRFNPAVLQCKGSDAADCLTSKQVEAVKEIYAGPHDSSGKSLFPGIEPGFERSWDRFVTGTMPGNSHNFDLAVPFAKYFLFGNANWNYLSWNFDEDLPSADRKLAGVLDATDPNLGAFRARGGKLLLYHGWQDSGIPPRNTVNYFKSVVSAMHHAPADAADDETAAFLRDANDTGNFARLFMVPGVEHCDRLGGPGPDRSNFFQALEAWVEQGKPPETILASHVTNGKIDRSRPLCPYPTTAQYSGHGGVDDASSFACKAATK